MAGLEKLVNNVGGKKILTHTSWWHACKYQSSQCMTNSANIGVLRDWCSLCNYKTCRRWLSEHFAMLSQIYHEFSTRESRHRDKLSVSCLQSCRDGIRPHCCAACDLFMADRREFYTSWWLLLSTASFPRCCQCRIYSRNRGSDANQPNLTVVTKTAHAQWDRPNQSEP